MGIQIKLGFGFDKKQPEVATKNQPLAEVSPEVEPPAEKERVTEIPQTADTPMTPILNKEDVAYIEPPLVFGIVNQTDLTSSVRERLNQVAILLKKDNTIELAITGHTCNLGNELINDKVRRERALAVAEYLMEQGITKERITLGSKGETEPLVPNTSPENRKKNRRVVIDILHLN
ncbi:OmpA family protein [Flavobacteriaceae bacterium F08102]|nr:OmpA family protein [Flavobacteriaceae bacterium F08102]